MKREERDHANEATGSVEGSSVDAMSPRITGGEMRSAGPFDPHDMASANAVSKETVERTHATGSIDFLSKSPTQPELGNRRDGKPTGALSHQVLRPMVAGQTFSSTELKDESAVRVDLTRSSDPISSRYVIRSPSLIYTSIEIANQDVRQRDN
jgi:hypothetical protein